MGQLAVIGHLWWDSWSSQSYQVQSAKFTTELITITIATITYPEKKNWEISKFFALGIVPTGDVCPKIFFRKLLWFLLIGNRTSCYLILSEIIIVIDKWTPASRLSYFVNHSNDYRPNWTPLVPIIIIYKTNLGNPGSVRAGRASIYEGLATLRRTIQANSALP